MESARTCGSGVFWSRPEDVGKVLDSETVVVQSDNGNMGKPSARLNVLDPTMNEADFKPKQSIDR